MEGVLWSLSVLFNANGVSPFRSGRVSGARSLRVSEVSMA